MRVLLVALCTVAACTLQTFAAFSQVQKSPKTNQPELSSSIAAFPILLEVCLNALAAEETHKTTEDIAVISSVSIRLVGQERVQSESTAALLSDNSHCSVVEENALLEIQESSTDAVQRTSQPNEVASNLANNTHETIEAVESPLERPPVRLLHLETANQLIARALQLSFGSHQTLSDDTPGTGSQLYYGELDWGITDDLQVSLSAQQYDDPPTSAINGEFPNINLTSVASSVKYRLLNGEQLALSLQGALEILSVSSDLFNTGESVNLVGAIHAPLTYTVSPDFQIHLTPGVSFLPSQLGDSDFYDTVFTVGTGINWQPSEQWLVYSALNLPLGPGGNTIETDQTIGRQFVWSVGTRYNVTPRTGLNLYATNGLGVTPSTAILTSVPNGDNVLVGVELQHTPDVGLGYRDRFDDTARLPLSERDQQLLVDGFTLASANTLTPGNVAVTTGAGTEGNFGLGLAYSPDEALQIEASLEQFGESEDKTAASDSLRYTLGARVQLMDQRLGSPVSLSARILGGRDTDDDQQVGVLFADLPLTYEVNSQLALFFDPRVALSGNDTRVGLGLGVNYEIAQGLQLIGEVTPMFEGDRAVWALGTRYSFPKNALSLDAYATNAVGRYGLGTLVGEADTRFGAGVNWIVGQ